MIFAGTGFGSLVWRRMARWSSSGRTKRYATLPLALMVTDKNRVKEEKAWA